MDDKVVPSLVWSCSAPKRIDPNLFSGTEQCKPWTRSKELPGRSYKTSYTSYHPRLHPISTFVETKPLKLAPDAMLRDYRFKKMQYTTTHQKAYYHKVNFRALSDSPNVPHTIGFNLNYQWTDKLRTFPPCKRDPGLSEMKDKYKRRLLTSQCPGYLNDIRPNVVCQIYCPGKEAIDKIDANVNCIQKILDPYISTTQCDYVNYEPGEIRKYKHVKVKPVQIMEKKNIYDECFLGKQFMDRFVRKKIPIVPNRGMQSETMESYKVPLDELAHKKLHVCSILKPKTITKGEVMATPAMYNTEYDHIGHNWPLSSVV